MKFVVVNVFSCQSFYYYYYYISLKNHGNKFYDHDSAFLLLTGGKKKPFIGCVANIIITWFIEKAKNEFFWVQYIIQLFYFASKFCLVFFFFLFDRTTVRFGKYFLVEFKKTVVRTHTQLNHILLSVQ